METIVHILRQTIGLDSASIGIGAIERAVHQRVAACKATSLARYRQLLQESPEELGELIDALIVPETWFFRDQGAFAAVAAEAQMPDQRAQLRYLCVPCATGEEPLSLAMVLLDAGVPADRFHIDAFDISDRLVAHAKQGVYGRNSFRGCDSAIRARYFQKTSQGCAIDPAVHRQATFQQANLLDDASLHGAQVYDAIFCRNLLIYFDPEARVKAVRKLTRLLRDGGLLCVAPAETGLLLRNGFVSADAPQAFAFRKGKTDAKTQVPEKRQETRPTAPQLTLPALQWQPKIKLVALSPSPMPEPANVPLPALEEAIRLADEGRYEEIPGICRAHMEAHGASAHAYYLLALVSDASGRYEEAATLYRKALYLEPQHRDALAHFSLLADKLGETAAAGALRRRAMRIKPNAA